MALRNPNVTRFFKLLESTNGRDKLSKLLQYTARYCAWHLMCYKPHEKEWIARATSVNKSVSSARKLTRLFKWCPLLIKIQNMLSIKGMKLQTKELIGIFSSFMLSNYFFWDGFVWAIQTGLMKGDSNKYLKRAMYGWFFACLSSVVISFMSLIEILQKTHKPTENMKSVVLSCIKNTGDGCIAAKAIQLADFSEGWIGICGIVSALIGMHELWPSSQTPPSSLPV